MVDAVVSSAIMATLIALTAWLGSRLVRCPSLWHAVWVLALVKLFVPPVLPISMGWGRDDASQRSGGTVQEIMPARIELDTTQNTNATLLTESIPATAMPRDTLDDVGNQATISFSLPAVPWLIVASWIWAIGSLVALTRSLVQIYRFDFAVRDSNVADNDTLAIVCRAVSMIGVSATPPGIRMIDQTVPPLLWPVGRKPTIVLPTTWWRRIDAAERQAVLMHELVHWRRGDHWVRLLQWIAGTVFWWHPLVWIARRELHRLEEQCCDAEVMHRLPASGRSYASALLSAADWLQRSRNSDGATCQPSPLAMPMSSDESFRSFQRRLQMLPTHRYRPWTRRSTVVLFLFAALPLAIGVRLYAQQTDSAEVSTLTGQIRDTDGTAIADAKVRVVVPATELRFDVDLNEHQEAWGTTDADGKYTIEVASIDAKTTASIDILHPGHRRLVGTLMSGGDPNEVTLQPGQTTTFDASLPATLYFAGRLVDPSGKPIAGVDVSSSVCTTNACYGVERTRTDADGRFAVYSYEADMLVERPNYQSPTAAIGFTHDRYSDTELSKLEDLKPAERTELLVEMNAGVSIGGVVQDADGAPVADVLIAVNQALQRKAMRTDASGKFRFDGVKDAKAILSVIEVAANRKAMEAVATDASNLETTIVLKNFASPIRTSRDVLGMTLTDVTPAIDAAYDLSGTELGRMMFADANNDPLAGYRVSGAMVGDRGDDFERFEIGELQPGYVFWMVGNDKIASTSEFITRLLAEAKSPTIPPGGPGNMSASVLADGGARVRVVYNFTNENGRGTNTQYMRLTREDIVELERLVESLRDAN